MYCYVKCRYAQCHYAEYHYALCHYHEYFYAKCRYAECCGALSTIITALGDICYQGLLFYLVSSYKDILQLTSSSKFYTRHNHNQHNDIQHNI